MQYPEGKQKGKEVKKACYLLLFNKYVFQRFVCWFVCFLEQVLLSFNLQKNCLKILLKHHFCITLCRYSDSGLSPWICMASKLWVMPFAAGLRTTRRTTALEALCAPEVHAGTCPQSLTASLHALDTLELIQMWITRKAYSQHVYMFICYI